MAAYLIRLSLGLTAAMLAGALYIIPKYLLILPKKQFAEFNEAVGSAAMACLLLTLAIYPASRLYKLNPARFLPLRKFARLYHPPLAIFASGLALIHGLSILDQFRFTARFVSGAAVLAVLLILLITGMFKYRSGQQKFHLPLGMLFFVLLLIHTAFPQLLTVFGIPK